MSRGTDILEAATPYLPPERTGTVELLKKVWGLMDSITESRTSADFVSCGTGRTADVEGMLRAIRELCNEKERRTIDMIMNIFSMRRMMDMMNLMRQAGENGGDMWEMLKSNLSPEQQEQFEMMQMMMTMMNTSEQGE